jgi:hypothetical protein
VSDHEQNEISGHPNADKLADFTAETLPSADAADVERHVAACATCRSTIDGLAEVTLALRSAPDEVQVPGDVAARITATIENAADNRAAEAERAHEVAIGAPVAWFRRRLPRLLAAAAAVGVLGLAGYVAFSDTPFDSGSNDTTAADAPDQAEIEQESAAGDDSDEDAGGDGEEAADDAEVPDQDRELFSAPMSETEIQVLMRDIHRSQLGFTERCGREIAIEQQQQLIGSAETDDGVLIVLEDVDAELLYGWSLPTCGSTSSQATAEVVTLATPFTE